MNFDQLNFNQLPPKSDRKHYINLAFFILLAIGIIYSSSRFGLNGREIEIANEDGTLWNKVSNLFSLSFEKKLTIENDPDYVMPRPEDDRWDVLVLGVRGEDDENAEEAGALLTDTIMVLSYDKTTKKTSLISIPRDLYVRIYDGKKAKINSVYEVGVLRKNNLGFTRKLFSRITGIYIDNVIVLDFSSFRQIIDDLGGVDIELNQPFVEKQQWGYEFNLPAGKNHLDGQATLYFARSRFSTSDFDRAQRQQKIILAIKDKIFKLNLLADPIKTLGILNSIRSNVETDLKLWDAGSLINLAGEFSGAEDKIKRYVITTDNLVYETHVQTDAGNLYVLLPKEDNLLQVKQMFQEILK